MTGLGGGPVLVINPNSSAAVTEGLSRALDGFRRPGGPAIDCVTDPAGPPGIVTQREVDEAALRVGDLVERRRDAGAVMIACYSRPGLDLAPGGAFARIIGRDRIRVNSLHGQGLLDLGGRVVVEGVAEDGTIEAIRIAEAPGFALGVQWHAEHDPQTHPVNGALFAAFGQAVAAHRAGRRAAAA